MALPKQVQMQSEAVQELYKELNGETEAQATVEAEAGAVEGQVQEAVANSVTEQAPQSGTEEQGQPDTKTKDSWEQKYKTLQGMYNAEVPKLTAQNRELSSRVSQMEELLSNLSNQPVQQAPMSNDPLITDKDVQEYGDSIDVMRRAAREELAQSNARVAQLEQTIRQLQTSVVPQVQQMSHRQAQSAEQSFWSELSSKVPNWNEINDNQEFQSWLLDVDPLTGITRQTYLEDAQGQLDVNRVARFFQSWPGANSTPVAQTSRKAQTSQLEKQVAPGRGRSSASAMPSEGQTYSPDDIKGFFEAVRKGKYKGREDERGRIERDIFAAQREGRIVTA